MASLNQQGWSRWFPGSKSVHSPEWRALFKSLIWASSLITQVTETKSGIPTASGESRSWTEKRFFSSEINILMSYPNLQMATLRWMKKRGSPNLDNAGRNITDCCLVRAIKSKWMYILTEKSNYNIKLTNSSYSKGRQTFRTTEDELSTNTQTGN